MSERLTRRVFLRRTALATAGFAATYLVAAPAGAVIFPGGQTAVIANTDGDSVRLRSAPSKSADVQAMVGEGTVVVITNGPKDAEGVTWYQVQFGDKSGWIAADYIAARKLSDYAAVTFTDGQGVRLRDNTDTGAKAIGMVPEAAIVQILAGPRVSADGTPWYQINYAGNQGYVMGTYLAPSAAPPDIKAAQIKKATDAPPPAATPDVVAGNRVKVANTDGADVRLRSDAGSTAEVVMLVAEGTVVTVTDKPKTDAKGVMWVPVSFDGTKGFINSLYVAKTDAEPTKKKPLAPPPPASTATQIIDATKTDAPAASTNGAKIAAEAMKYIGARYVWGGTSPSGFDCSGYMMYVVLKATGKQIPRTTFAQVEYGQPVARENLQPGDFVFFANTYTAGISHAGIYVGNGRFAHAESETTGVLVSSLSSGYYAAKYYSARRIA